MHSYCMLGRIEVRLFALLSLYCFTYLMMLENVFTFTYPAMGSAMMWDSRADWRPDYP